MNEAPMTKVKTGMLASIVRTFVPMLVGGVVAVLAAVGLELDGATLDAVGAAITVGVGTAYYALVRELETRVAPGWGWLLGKAGAPEYRDAIEVTGQEVG